MVPVALVVAIGVALFTYAAVRAYTVSFTYDEAYTYLEHVLKNVFYQTVQDKMGGNHHLLNVWGMWLSHAMFGDGEFALRLPNLLAYIGYLYASARLSLQARGTILTIGCFALLNLHPYLIDFFSLARGYGIANGFMMLSLWQAWRYLREGHHLRRVVLAAVLAALSVMAHVIMVNFLLAFAGTMALILLLRMRRSGSTAIRAHLMAVNAIALVGLAVIIPNVLGMASGGSLNFGCHDWWTCSMRTLAERVVYHIPYALSPLMIIEKALWWTLGICTVAVVLVWRARQWPALRPFLFGLGVLALCVLSFLLQRSLFGVPLPESRTALFLLPMVAFVLVAALLAWPGRRWMPGAISVAAVVPLVVLMHDAYNTRYAVEWKPGGEVRKVLELVEKDHLPLDTLRPMVNLSTGFGTSGVMGYYIRSRGWSWLGFEVRMDTGFVPADYYLVEFDAHHLVDERHWTKLFESPETGLALYRDERMRRTFTITLNHQRYLDADHAAGRFPVMDWVVPADTPAGQVLVVGAIKAREQGNSNWLGLFLEHWRKGRLLSKRSQPSHLQVNEYGVWQRNNIMLQIPGPLQSGDTLRFVVWPCFAEPIIELGPADLWIMR